MEYHRVNRGKEQVYYRRTAQYNAMLGWFAKLVQKIKWKFFNVTFCPNCMKDTKWNVAAIHTVVPTRREQKIVVGVSHTCTICKLQIRKGLDTTAEKYISGIYQKDLTAQT